MSAPMSTSPERASTPLLAVDTGGTFTDLVLLANGELRTLKVPSTPHDPSQAVLDGIREILGEAQEFTLLHGSTVATNALLERRGARVVLVTNEGFEDVIEIGRQDRPQLYALVGHRLPPLVDRENRIGVPGRLGPEGEELEALDHPRLGRLADEIRTRGAESVAVSLLHSYANPEHEQRVADEIAGGLQGSDIPVSVSSEIVPEFREYERTSTTVLNAYVAPIMDRYLGRLAREAGATRVSIMGSNGGALPIERARREPVQPRSKGSRSIPSPPCLPACSTSMGTKVRARSRRSARTCSRTVCVRPRSSACRSSRRQRIRSTPCRRCAHHSSRWRTTLVPR